MNEKPIAYFFLFAGKVVHVRNQATLYSADETKSNQITCARFSLNMTEVDLLSTIYFIYALCATDIL